jgi:RNA polymerase sigma-70 factor (ECF subfamily)
MSSDLRGQYTILKDTDKLAAHIPTLRRYARALTRDYTAADDLLQDTLERAWRRFYLWRSGSNLRAWLFTIMHNLHMNQVKAQPSKWIRPGENEALDLPVTSTQERRLELRDLHNALGRLPAEQRDVILLIGLEQMSYEEAATVLGVPIGTVMSRLSRGREQLRVLMNRDSAAAQLKIVK